MLVKPQFTNWYWARQRELVTLYIIFSVVWNTRFRCWIRSTVHISGAWNCKKRIVLGTGGSPTARLPGYIYKRDVIFRNVYPGSQQARALTWCHSPKSKVQQWPSVFKIETLIRVSFWRALKFQSLSWRIGSNPRR